MRTIGQALPRYSYGIVAGEPFWREEGNGLGFSIGGFHPFRINDWKDTVKKIDSNITRALKIDKIPVIGDIHKKLTGAVDRFDRSVNKDFGKAKKWSQEHRKQLQIAAAVAAAAVGGWYYFGAAGASGAAGAGATQGGVAATTYASGGALTALPTTATIVPASLLAPVTVGAETVGTVAATAAAAGGGSSLLSTIGGVLGTVAKEAGPLLALSKALGVVPQGQAQPQGGDYGGGYFGGFGGGGGGGGGFLGPATLDTMGQGQPEGAQAPQAGLPTWAWIAGGGILLYFLFSE